MNARPPAAIMLLTLFTFGCLYAPQPLLPTLAGYFAVDAETASLLITVAMLPLGVAPLIYGFVLQGVAADRMMRWAGVVLASCQFGMAIAEHWWQLLALRSLAGLTFPALLTAIVTYVSVESRDARVRQAVAWYISATILGGFVGRAISGVLTDLTHWRLAFAFWAIGLAVTLLAAQGLDRTSSSHLGVLRKQAFVDILKIPGFGAAYVAIFWVFFVFAGFLNVLPFRLAALSEDVGATAIGLAYGGYLVGVAVTLGGHQLQGWLGSETRLFGLAIGLYGLGLAVFAIPHAAAIYGGMFVFCGGMFILHGRLSGQVNERARNHQGVVNGLYIASYYCGGAVGSWLTPVFYRAFGWEAQLGLLWLLLAGVVLAVRRMLRHA